MSAGGVLVAGLRVLRLSPAERRRVVVAALQLTRASLELRVVPSGRIAPMLGTLQAPADRDEAVDDTQLSEARGIGDTVARVADRLPWRPTCLRQALAVQRMLRRRGIASSLHLGVTAPGVAEAHAWVTVAGQPVVGRPGLERFVPLAAFG